MTDAVKKLADWIRTSDNIVFFGGAGVSTESGIPDFRGKAGIYKTVSEYGYNPETILSHSFFEKNEPIFFDYVQKSLIFPDAKPNNTHNALAQLEILGKLKAVITQNIDGLHSAAGSKNVLELHGSLYRNYCVDCGRQFPMTYVMNGGVPHCDRCGGVVRPDIVLFEEALNEHLMSRSAALIKEAHLLIVGGTSLAVFPAAGLINYYSGNRLVLINKTSTAFDSRADLVINESLGTVFGDIMSCTNL